MNFRFFQQAATAALPSPTVSSTPASNDDADSDADVVKTLPVANQDGSAVIPPFVPNPKVAHMLERMQFKGRLGKHEQGMPTPLQPQRVVRPSNRLEPAKLTLPINFVAAPTLTPPDCAYNNADSSTASQDLRLHNERLQAQLQQAQADLDATRAELKDARSRLGVAHRELAQLKTACPAAALPPCSTCNQTGHLPSSCPLRRQSKIGIPPQRPGEPECAHFVKTGHCRFGAKCRFHHPPTHKPPASETGMPPEPPQPQPSIPTATLHARAYTALHGRTSTAPNKPGLGYASKAPPLFQHANRKGACSICGDETSLVLWYTDRIRLPDPYSTDLHKYDAPLKRAHDTLQICTNCRTTHQHSSHLQHIFSRSLAYCSNHARHSLTVSPAVHLACARLSAFASDADMDSAAVAALADIEVPQDTTVTDIHPASAGFVIAGAAVQVAERAARQSNRILANAALALARAAVQKAETEPHLTQQQREILASMHLPHIPTAPSDSTTAAADVRVNDTDSSTAIITLTKQNDDAEKMLAAQQQQLKLLDPYIANLLNMPPSPALDQVQQSVQALHAAAQQALASAQHALTQAGTVAPQHAAQLTRAMHIAQRLHALTDCYMATLGLT